MQIRLCYMAKYLIDEPILIIESFTKKFFFSFSWYQGIIFASFNNEVKLCNQNSSCYELLQKVLGMTLDIY